MNTQQPSFSWFWRKENNTPISSPVFLPQLFFVLVSPEKCGKGIRFAADAVSEYRATGNVSLKNDLPVFTPCATVKTKMSSALDKIISYSGLTQVDIDAKDNPELLRTAEDAQKLRDRLAKLPFVALSAISASGKGVWLLVAIGKPEFILSYHQAYINYFLENGIKIDRTKGGNPLSLRYYSPDPGAILNATCEPIEITEIPVIKPTYNAPKPALHQATTGYISSIDDYNRRGEVLPLLSGHGWQICRTIGQKTILRRPGRNDGHQAEWDEVKNMLFVFSDSAEPFEGNQWYSRASTWGLLHGIRVNQPKELASALRAEGWGHFPQKT